MVKRPHQLSNQINGQSLGWPARPAFSWKDYAVRMRPSQIPHIEDTTRQTSIELTSENSIGTQKLIATQT
jgi:hypothetical protein